MVNIDQTLEAGVGLRSGTNDSLQRCVGDKASHRLPIGWKNMLLTMPGGQKQ